jgi:Protease inhibitor Inh
MGKLLSVLTLVSMLALAGCASTGVAVQNAGTDQQLAPVQGGNVQTSALPPIGPNGEVQGPTGVAPLQPGGTQVANADGTTGAPGGDALPNSAGRDLGGGLTIEKLLGRWTMVSGTDQCPINLTQTAKGGTGRYRASAPACGIKGLAGVTSWQLTGAQVQLYDDRGLIGTLVLSGNRFIGTLSGGTGISMVG